MVTPGPEVLRPVGVALLVALLVAAVVGVVGTAGWLLVRGWRERRAHRGACWVSVLPPPQADPGGAAVLWAQVAGLLTPPRWRAWLPGAPHLSWEYVLRPSGITLGIWVPATVPAALVASAVRAAWPGSRTDVTELTGTEATGISDARAAGRAAGRVVIGGVLRLARTGALPLDDDLSGADPLGALLGTAGLLGRGQEARVQVLARPVPAGRLARAATGRGRAGSGPGRLAARGVAGLAGLLVGVLGAVVREVTDVAAPAGRPGSGRRGRDHGGHAGGFLADLAEVDVTGRAGRLPPGPGRVMASARDRAVAGKATGSGSGAVVVVRYAASTPIPRSGRSDPDSKHGERGEHGEHEGRAVQSERDARAQARAQSRRAAHAVASSFAVFSSGHNRLRRRRLWRPAGRVLAARRLRRGDLLSVAELGALAHLPTAEHVAGLRRAGAAAVAPPPQVPGHGPGIRPIGDADAVAGRPIGLAVADARHHVWIVGATGSGKSTLLVHSVLADAQARRSAVVLDPKGDLITEVLPRLPRHARERVVLIDPARPGRGPSGPVWPTLNPLAPHPGSSVLRHGDAIGDAASEHVVTIFSRVFASAWGWRSEDLLRVACLTVRAGREVPTLAALPGLLSDPDTRARAVAQLPRGSALREFWSWFDALSDQARSSIAAPLLNKLRALLLRPFAERVLCGGPSTVDLTRLLDRGGLLLVRLPKLIGEDTTRLLGSLILAQVWQAALTRAAIPEHARRDAHVVLDECQNFLNLPYRLEDLLAEARGYRVGLTLAHQHLDQLPTELRHGISTNARSKIVFACSADDANRLARHTEPELSAHDLHHLDRFHAAARLMAHGSESRAFTLTTRDLPPLPTPAPAAPRLPSPSRPVPARPSRPIPSRPVSPSGGSPCPTTATTSPTGSAPRRPTRAPRPAPARPVPVRPVPGPGRRRWPESGPGPQPRRP